MKPNEMKAEYSPQRMGPFRRAVLRGLGILLPPLLTIVILLWMGNTVADYLLEPLENATRWVLVEKVADIRTQSEMPPDLQDEEVVTYEGTVYRQTEWPDNKFIPLEVHETVRKSVGRNPMPRDAKAIYTWYVNHQWLPRRFVVPVFLCLFLLILYLLGKFLAAGVGRFFFNQVERLIHRVPLVRNVYGSVKQVTDFLFTEPDVNYTRVVAIEYPRKGIWTMAFVTSEGMWHIRGVAKEPVLGVFVPTSPMPLTGFALTVKRSETVDLDISIDQAVQFMVSCGVVVPPPIIGVPPQEGEEVRGVTSRDVTR